MRIRSLLLIFVFSLSFLVNSCGFEHHSSLKNNSDESSSNNDTSTLSEESLGLDLKKFWELATRKASATIIKFFYDRPSLIQNAGLDFHPDLIIPSDDGKNLQISYYLPKNYNKKESFPAVIFLNPWGSSANANQLSRLPQRLTNSGYIVLLLTARGFGYSEGQAAFAGIRDQKDVGVGIDWLLENTKADVKNIGVIGISYGGGIGIMSLTSEPRLKTAVGINAWTDLTDDGGFLDGNGINERAGKFLVDFGDLMECRIDEAIEIRKKMLDPNQYEEIKKWGSKKSPRYFLDQLHLRKPPIFFVHTYNDSFFKPNGILRFYKQYEGPKKVSFYHGVHGTNLMFEGYADQGVGGEVIAWFDRWLKDKKSDLQLNTVTYSIRNKKIRGGPLAIKRQMIHYKDWDDKDFPKQHYYLSNGFLSGENTSVDRETPLVMAEKPAIFGGDQDTKLILEGLFGWPVKQNLKNLDSRHTTVYYSKPLPETKIRSISTLDIKLRSKSRNPQVMAYLFDQPRWGDAQLITQGSLSVTYFEGDIGQGKLEFHAIAYDLEKGHRLALVIDTRDWDFLVTDEQNNDFSIIEGGKFSTELSLSIEEKY